MTPDLDAHGPAAPPRSNGELSFELPWQRRLFATTMALCDAGVLDYEQFRHRLITEIAVSTSDTYWTSWQLALESLVASMGLVGTEELASRARQFAEHH